MNATYPKTNLWNKFFLAIIALPFGMIVLLLASIAIIASLVMILTPLGMMLAPTWSVQLFYWKFESALDAWYLPILGILLGWVLVYIIKGMKRLSTQFAGLLLNPSRNCQSLTKRNTACPST
jgi:hypothetical protein